MARVVDFTVTGEEKIHCAACVARIGAGLRRLRGVRDVQASEKTQRVKVTFEPDEVSPDELRARLEEMGYEVETAGC